MSILNELSVSVFSKLFDNYRPVEDKDTWCYFPQKDYYDPETPYGIIVTLPYGYSASLNFLDNTMVIVRSKKIGDKLLIQLARDNNNDKLRWYSIIYQEREVTEIINNETRKRTRRFVNIQCN